MSGPEILALVSVVGVVFSFGWYGRGIYDNISGRTVLVFEAGRTAEHKLIQQQQRHNDQLAALLPTEELGKGMVDRQPRHDGVCLRCGSATTAGVFGGKREEWCPNCDELPTSHVE